MDSTSAEASGATTILDLNDDCLLALFEHFDLLDLCAVADVCSRFQTIAKACFDHSKRNTLNVPEDLWCRHKAVNVVLLKTSRVLRIFGSFITEINEDHLCVDENLQPEYESEFFNLLLQYCCGTLTKLKVEGHFAPETVRNLQPLFKTLHKLVILSCGSIPDLPPSWFPELRELELELIDDHNYSHDIVHLDQFYHKLNRISFKYVDGITDDDIEKFLMCSPKLKEIELCECSDLESRTVGAIAEHATEIEKLNLTLCFDDYIGFFNYDKLRNLRSLELNLTCSKEKYMHDTDYSITIIEAIIDAEIPLKHLSLEGLWKGREAYVEGNLHHSIQVLSKLQTLETLKLSTSEDLTVSDIMFICKHLKELTELQLDRIRALTTEDILILLKNVEKLKLLLLIDVTLVRHVPESFKFDAKVFEKILEIVKNRAEKSRLEICLDEGVYNVNIPDYLRETHKDSVTVNENIYLKRILNA